MINFYCDYCQSFPDGYYCSHPSMFFKHPFTKKKIARECLFESLKYLENVFHPCPFFKGEIREYFSNGYYANKILEENGIVQEKEWFSNE